MAKKFLTLLLLIFLITPAFYLPQQATRTDAFLGFGDLVIDVKALTERIIDAGAMVLAQQMIDRMVSSTIKWAQSGFDGNPAYVTNPSEYFTGIADGVAGDFIRGSDLGYLCTPFQTNIRLSLTQQYYEPQPFQCTLTGVIGNIDQFYSDFSQGGWDAWFTMTQQPTNNPYGAYLKAKIELDSQVAQAVSLKKDELDWNQGFLSWQTCPEKFKVTAAQAAELSAISDYKAGDCLSDSLMTTNTPGSTIKSQLDQVLPVGLNKLVTAQHIDQLVSAFTAGLLQRYVFGPKGLFNNDDYEGEEGNDIVNPGPGAGSGGSLDIDGDGLPDGIDRNGDGFLDACYYGGLDNSLDPPCVGSATYIGGGTPGTGGGDDSGGGDTGTGGPGTITGTLSPTQVSQIVAAPQDALSWPEATQITSVDFSGNWSFAFDKKDGANRWPDQFGGPGVSGSDTIQFTVWLFLKVNGQWVGAPFIQVWHGRDGEGGPGNPYYQLPQNWYYGSQWAPMTGHQLQQGEQVGFMVTAGNSRLGGVPQFKERSNIVLVTLPMSTASNGGGSTDSLVADLQSERAQYPSSFASLCPNTGGLQPTSCHLGYILNSVAWENRSAGWGLNSKTSGHRCPSPAGEVACDIIQHGTSKMMYDVFISAETEATPTWNIAGSPNPPGTDRPWVAPIET